MNPTNTDSCALKPWERTKTRLTAWKCPKCKFVSLVYYTAFAMTDEPIPAFKLHTCEKCNHQDDIEQSEVEL